MLYAIAMGQIIRIEITENSSLLAKNVEIIKVQDDILRQYEVSKVDLLFVDYD